MFWLILLVYGSFISHRVFSEEDSKLLLIQALFRHGDRAPMFLYPKDPNSEDSWPEGLRKLTMLGKKQHYALGTSLRSMYQDFITSNPNEVLVNSSATHQCLTSAAATIASLYAPEGSWKMDADLNWQPIPIYYQPLDQDKYLSYKATCPQLDAEIKKHLNSEMIRTLFQKYQATFEVVSNYSGLNISKGLNAFHLHDTLRAEKQHNLTIPEWVDLYWEDLEETEASMFQIFIKSQISLRLRAGPLLQYIDQNMKKKINGDLPDLKVQLYSSHDINVAAVLRALNFTNMPRPPYCAALLFELHEMPDASMAVRLLYMNSTDPLAGMPKPHILVLDGYSEFCPVANFTKAFQHLIPENWEHECQLNASDSCETENGEIACDVHINRNV